MRIALKNSLIDICHLVAVWMISTLTLLLSSEWIPGFRIHEFHDALIASLMMGLLNIFFRPILFILTLPLNVLSFGAFTLILNAVIIKLTAQILPGFEITNWGSAILSAAIQSVIHMVILIVTK